ncbi:MAG: AI-2E family transporter [Spirulinaceae cyanobacterium RM2_2_10]|nr:AI-2E family transporter [Spirulinaceae cyanobacterium SM2_1_0]NJO20160.1 AI-2E family transporter [Spirulinaceae cyanobacterium RM2_2_10]
MMSERRITVATTTLAAITAGGLLLAILWQLRGLLVVLAIAIVIAATLAPTVQQVERWGLPRWLAVVLVYLGFIATLTGLGLLIGPTVFEQIQRLARKLPGFLEVLSGLAQDGVVRFGLRDPQVLEQVNQFFNVQALTAWAFRTSQELIVRSYGLSRGIIIGALSLILALLLSGYMLAGSEKLVRGLVSLFPTGWEARLEQQVQPMARRMGGYIQGRILVSTLLAVGTSIGLRLLGLKEYALGLGAIAGVTNLIPFFGPVLGAIPALLVAIAQGGWLFLWVFLLFLIVQNLETYVLDPLLVGSSVQVPPLYQLLAVLGGAQLLGILGALIVPPWIAGGSVLLENLYLQPKAERARQAEQLTVVSPPLPAESLKS